MNGIMHMTRPELRLDWATHQASEYACKTWHYSRSTPVGKQVKVGVWEDGRFIGVVLYAWGANKSLGSPYGLAMTECCELVRVALSKHKTPVSRILSVSFRFLKKSSPGLRLIVSFADPTAGHHGGIYQASNWIYTGTCLPTFEYRLNGLRLNKRAYTGVVFGGKRSELPCGAVKVQVPGKHRYLMPLDDDMRSRVLPLSHPYPKRLPEGGTEVHSVKGGASLTQTLHGVPDAD